jgi:hypothetical protein
LLGQAGSLASLSQTIPTISGQAYLVSFWLSNPGHLSSGNVTPNEFRLQWNGATLYDRVNMNVFTWTNLQFVASGGNASATVSFAARNDNDYFGFDDVSVEAIPAPSFLAAAVTNGNVTLSWTALTGLSYQAQYSTYVPATSWIDLGGPITATGASNGVITITDVLPPDPQRFYQVVLLP